MGLRLSFRQHVAAGHLAACLFLVLPGHVLQADDTVPVVGRHGMVSSAHPQATKAGIQILKNGGNAFDAAVAVAATLNVVEPMMSGIGGYGTILIYDAKRKEVRYLNSSGKIPSSLNPDVFRKPNPKAEENRRGAAAISTPGNLHAWETLSRDLGLLKWEDLFLPAIRIAEEGFLLDATIADNIASAFDEFSRYTRSFYGRGGKPLGQGDRLVQKDLGQALRRIAEKSPTAFYEGPLAKLIVNELRKKGSFLSLDDLRLDRTEWFKPIHISYRGNDVYTASPPSTAFCSLIRLGMMSQFDVALLGHNSPGFLHRFIESTKHAFWCRLRYAGDPDINPPPLAKLLSEKYWEDQVSRIDLNRAIPFTYPGLEKSSSQHTTHFVVADSQGNIVCATQTLGNIFGSRIMPEGTGVWMNNSLAFCTFEPKGNPMDAFPGHRKLSGDCPTIVIRGGKPWIAVGTPGGHTIGQTVPQIIMNLIDFGMDIQKAIAAPRISFVEPDLIAVEEAIPEDVRNQLIIMGHKLRVLRQPDALGNAHGLTVEYGEDGRPARFIGGADPRHHGQALGY